SRQPHTAASNINYPSDADIDSVRGRLQPGVPLITLIDHADEPEIDGADDIRQAHADPLAEMAEFVGQYAGKLLQRHARGQRHANRENKVAAQQQAQPTPTEAGGRVDIAVDVDPLRPPGADQTANPFDELKQQWVRLRRHAAPAAFLLR